MTLPTLTTCPKPDCLAPITHWHSLDGDPGACRFALRGEPCPHGAGRLPCYAPRATAPLHLPDVDTLARKILETCETWEKAELNDLNDAPLPKTIAQAVLDLIAAHQPAWVPINVDDIRPGMRVRWVRNDSDTEGSFTVRQIGDDRLYFEGGYVSRQMSYAWSVDPRTVPEPTLTERIRAALNDSPESRITLDVADVEALLDMVGGEDK